MHELSVLKPFFYGAYGKRFTGGYDEMSNNLSKYHIPKTANHDEIGIMRKVWNVSV